MFARTWYGPFFCNDRPFFTHEFGNGIGCGCGCGIGCGFVGGCGKGNGFRSVGFLFGASCPQEKANMMISEINFIGSCPNLFGLLNKHNQMCLLQ